ncbi:MAG: hypothetical protein KKA54_02885 [Proteobacteria bacterium]|nr:hypothetical protein [Pseudomonadota bacterium]MBU0965306.1 hypothetical protein [Pseudomonadota bacterium]
MAVTIHNKTNRPVMVRFNSGLTCYLNAGDSSTEIMDGEIAHNEKLSRLQHRGIVEIIDAEKPAAVTAKTQKAPPKVTKNKKANP